MVNSSASAPVIIGLVVGIAFIALFAVVFTAVTPIGRNDRVTVVIPKGASEDPTISLFILAPAAGKSFMTPNNEIFIGYGGTVRWVNLDIVPALIAADDDSDPDFYNATKDSVLILPGASFEFTFNKPGEFGYHGKPWQSGTVRVCAC